MPSRVVRGDCESLDDVPGNSGLSTVPELASP